MTWLEEHSSKQSTFSSFMDLTYYRVMRGRRKETDRNIDECVRGCVCACAHAGKHVPEHMCMCALVCVSEHCCLHLHEALCESVSAVSVLCWGRVLLLTHIEAQNGNRLLVYSSVCLKNI